MAQNLQKKGGLRDRGQSLKTMAATAAASRGRLPTKRTINLAEVGVKKTDAKTVAAAVFLILVFAGVFGKFCVMDRLAAIANVNREAEQLRVLLNQEYARIASYEGIEDEYAHYTISGMTDEELSLVDRAEVVNMVEKETDISESSTTWSLSGNMLTLTVTGDTLQDINVLARRLEKYDLVNICSVTNAVKEEIRHTTGSNENGAIIETSTIVRANIIAYLEEPGEEDEKEVEGGEGK